MRRWLYIYETASRKLIATELVHMSSCEILSDLSSRACYLLLTNTVRKVNE